MKIDKNELHMNVELHERTVVKNYMNGERNKYYMNVDMTNRN